MQSGLPVARISPTAIDRYRECPRRFFWHDVERLDRDSAQSAEMIVGSAVHRALELAFQLHPHQRDEDALLRLLDASWRRFWKPSMQLNGEQEARHAAEEMLRQFPGNFDLGAIPLRLEQRVELSLPGGSRLVTRIDRVDRGRAGLRVIDYKTGRYQVDSRDLPGETAAMVHAIAIARLAGEPVERVSHFYLRSGEEVYWEPEAEDVGAAGERLKRYLREISTDATFAPQPGDGCRMCPFALRCPAGPAPTDLQTLLERERLPEAA